MSVRISIVIIEYHCMEQVESCVRSIQTHLNGVSKECIVLSNSGYTQEELERHSERFEDTRVIAAPRNLGYAGGVNMALSRCSGDYVYVVNPDCLLTDDGITAVMEEMDGCREWAISGPKVVDESGQVQPSCRRFPRPWTFLLVRSLFRKLPGASRERARYLMADFDRSSSRAVDWVSGGATLVKRECLAQMGGMDERYFLYMEDVDWCRTAWENGFKVVYCPQSRVIHAGRHQSIQGGLKTLRNVHLRWHLTSLLRYFRKYRWRVRPDSELYRQILG
ncbi:MAG TPA: glycosyltransferase family 2 protein [Gammaproteobacteria bacterium]|nr:glycosyltransferase family 2 protein [Gammaproteobacteria bacterium]